MAHEIPRVPSWENAVVQYPMVSNLNADPRLLGGSTLLCPLTQFISSQRMGMFNSNIVQALIPHGAEIPAIASGYEREFMKYTFNTSRMEQNATIIACIPKYKQNVGKSPIRFNPSFVLVYIGEEDGLVHYKDIARYVKGTDGFGYENIIKENFLRAGVGIPKGTEITHSKAVKGSQYGFGVNANVAYMSMKETAEDAFCMSQSLAERLTSTGIKTTVINIDKNMVPLNLYGTSDEYKFMPDLHENIREDGILCAFRNVNEASMIVDMTDQSLMIPQPIHDEIYYAPEPNAIIIDVDVYKNPNRQIKTPPHILSQFDKYTENNMDFHTKILEIYEKECKRGGKRPSPEFSVLVCRAVEILTANKQKVMGIKSSAKFAFKGEQIKFIQLVITYKYENKVTKGSKSTGREGAKGVNAVIRPDEDMPVNDYGVRADMIIGPEAVVNRMNVGQLYEQFMNCLSGSILRKMANLATVEDQYNLLLGWIHDVNPEYAKAVAHVTDTAKRREQYVRETLKKDLIVLVIPPFINTITEKWVLEMRDKYQEYPTPVEYNLRDTEGNLIRRVRTHKPVWIGKKYLFILCKIPHARSCGMSYVNQLQVPIRIKTKKHKSQYPIGLVPIRLGEDENRNIKMAVGKMAYRILSLYANSPEATQMLTEELLTNPYPSRLNWVDIHEEGMAHSNMMIKSYRHMLSTCGIDSENVTMTEDEERNISDRLIEAGAPLLREPRSTRREKK